MCSPGGRMGHSLEVSTQLSCAMCVYECAMIVYDTHTFHTYTRIGYTRRKCPLSLVAVYAVRVYVCNVNVCVSYTHIAYSYTHIACRQRLRVQCRCSRAPALVVIFIVNILGHTRYYVVIFILNILEH